MSPLITSREICREGFYGEQIEELHGEDEDSLMKLMLSRTRSIFEVRNGGKVLVHFKRVRDPQATFPLSRQSVSSEAV